MEKKKVVKKENIRLTDKELAKFMIVLGVDRVKYLFCYGKILLTSKQLDYLLSYED